MSVKSFLSKVFAKIVVGKLERNALNAIAIQENTLEQLISSAKNTAFGKSHGFNLINTYEDFKKKVPLSDYEDLKPYMERALKGEADVLWKGRPIYFCKTSGTTSGTKYIPISKESISNHIHSARNAILAYIHETGKSRFVDGKMIFLQGSPELDEKGPIPVGRLSGIVAHHVPGYLQKNRMPSYDVNCIDDWEEKVVAIANETIRENMTLISGIPPWVQMYYDKLLELSNKESIKEVFPNYSLFIYGGVNYEPYRAKMEKSLGKSIDSIELYPASEGFIAFQNKQNEEGLLLVIDQGIFYEFIPVSEFHNDDPQRISLKDVQLNVNYVLILNTNAGLWAYNIGDTIKFTSLKPFKIIVTGRIKHFISAFGEHVIGEEVEWAMQMAAKKNSAEVSEFHVAPQVNAPEGELPFHEWFIEFEKKPQNIEEFADNLDQLLQSKNSYYKDLISGKVLQRLKVREIPADGFNNFMKKSGKLGGQNKLPRLSNDRKIAEALIHE